MLFLNKFMNVAVIGFSDEARTIIHSLEQKLVDDVFIKYVLTDYKDLNNPIYNSIKHKVISNFDKIIDDLSIDTVLVLEDTAESYHYIKYALFAKKNVVTSSTCVISRNYTELAKLALENNVGLYIDSSVNFPMAITNIINAKSLNKVYHFHTIIDIPTLEVIGVMKDKKLSLEEAKEFCKIKEIDKNKSINEFAILAMLCFDSKIDVNKIYYRGLDGLDLSFLNILDRLGYRLRLQGSAYFNDDEIELVIEPVIHKDDCQLYHLDYLCTQSIIIYSSGMGYSIYTSKSGTNNKSIPIRNNINLIKNDIKTNSIPKNNFDCFGNENTFAKYIIKAPNLDMNIVDKKIGDIYITKHISGTKIKELGEKITFYARIDTQLSN